MKKLLLLSLIVAATAPVEAAPKPIRYFGNDGPMPFSQAVEVNGVLYLSGQIGVKPGENALVPGGIESETRQTMENIDTVLRGRGLTFDDVFKCTVMLADMGDWAKFNTVYRSYFKPGRLPARSAFGSTGLAYGGRLELECWARVR
ncbi:MAG: RidA family protein [Pseudomonadota bacterium]